jgi:pyrroloquinoline quinone biosynthesis protein D
MTEAGPAPARIAAGSVPRLPRHVKLRYDEQRRRWTLLAPERVFVPDEIAVDILQRCDGVATVDAIAGALAEKYGAPREEVARDVIEMLQDLADKGVVAA